ncbi:MAG: UDP-glucose--hexose-1-phosphate uridylyltransferase [Rhodothermales bacterium]
MSEASPGLFDGVHRRRNALTGEWVLVSPHRGKRPWQGQVEEVPADERPTYDPGCYLCPGNTRAGGETNPRYGDTFVFENDFAALQPGTPAWASDDPLLRAESESGRCRVICFSPRHDLTLPELDVADIRRVVEVWVDEYTRLGADPDIGYVQIFENKGAMMGCSNPHPHGQIWAERRVPVEPAKESVQQLQHFSAHGSTLLGDYLATERRLGDRLVCENEHFTVLVPYWAFWPFETLVVARRPVPDLARLTADERAALADILKRLTTRYDNLFRVSFPYSAGIHQAPTDGRPHPEWHLHLHFYPPLLRSATVKKFMVGYEMLGNPQRDILPEASAEHLRAMSETHYKPSH